MNLRNSDNDFVFWIVVQRPVLQVYRHEVLHADKATLQVLHGLGKEAPSKRYAWLTK